MNCLTPEYKFDEYAIDLKNVGINNIGEALRNKVEQYGVAIIPNVISSKKCQEMNSGMLDFFETITQNWETPFNRSDKKTFRNMFSLFPKHSMLIQNHQVGQAQVSWNLRQNPKIVAIFSKFWNENPNNMLVSFDGFSYHFPPEDTNRGWRRKTWFHTDQSFMRPDFECLQSWVTGNDVEEGDATLAFFEGSNKYHAEFGERFGEGDVKKTLGSGDWYKLCNDEQLKFYYDLGCEPKCIKCPAGSMVFWDSRTIHCGVESTKKRVNKKPRAVIYLCYTPRRLASEAVLRKRISAFENMRTTNHWPHKPKLFPKKPRTYGAELKEVADLPPPKLSILGKKLVGY